MKERSENKREERKLDASVPKGDGSDVERNRRVSVPSGDVRNARTSEKETDGGWSVRSVMKTTM